jgi:hypothetical protein
MYEYEGGRRMNLGRYAKTVTALVVGLIGWATLVVNSAPKHITAPEWIVLATVAATALGVYTAPNDPTVSELPVAELGTAEPMTVRLHPADIAALSRARAVRKRGT